jgi:hypothetical protein
VDVDGYRQIVVDCCCCCNGVSLRTVVGFVFVLRTAYLSSEIRFPPKV